MLVWVVHELRCDCVAIVLRYVPFGLAFAFGPVMTLRSIVAWQRAGERDNSAMGHMHRGVSMP